MKFYYGVNPAEKRAELLKSEAAKPFINELIKNADIAVNEESPSFKMSEFMLFFETGNRGIFEKKYFGRRRKCSNIMMAYWLTEDEKYLIPLIDYIGYICDEFTWCLPAHCWFPKRLSKGTVECNDLFQSETGRLFAEIVMCVGDKLPEYILDRMKTEVQRRIFPSLEQVEVLHYDTNGNPYTVENQYWWEDCKMNWATVCGAGCAMAALYFGTDEEKEKYLNRFIGCLDSYLEGIENDGCCLEGMAYWGYGFSHFVTLAQAVLVHTDGKIDYFKNDKVKQLALFPQRVRMSDSKVASISDGGEVFKFKIGTLSLLKQYYDEVELPDLKYGIRSGNVDSVCELLWFDENYKSAPRKISTDYLADAQWYVSKKEKFSFVAKGGHNDEPHNHNDIGSFMITAGDETFVADLGCGEYVKETFMPETRYNYVQNSSRGHSVPIVNGEYQCVGRQYCAKNVKTSENGFELDIENAYRDGIVSKIHRCFEICDSKVILRDTVLKTSSDDSVTERIVTRIEPVISENSVDCGIGKINFDSKKLNVSVSMDTYVAHNATNIVEVYLIDFIPTDKKATEFELEFEII